MKKYTITTLVIVQVALQLIANSETLSTENNYLVIKREDKQLDSRLNEKYTGYVYKITNIYNEPIEIKQIMLRKNASAQIAYLSVKIPEQDIKNNAFAKAKENRLKTLGLSYLSTIVSLPFKQMSNNIDNENAQKEAEKYDTNPNKPTTIEIGKSLEVKTMALKRYKPIITVFYKNPITEETMKLDI